MEVKQERPRPSPDYLMQLLNEKKLMSSLPNLCGIFTHLERLLDEGKTTLNKYKIKTKTKKTPEIYKCFFKESKTAPC